MFGIKNILLPVLNKLNTNQVGFVNAGEIIDEISLDKTAFGELAVAQYTPFIQNTGVYELIPANFREYTTLSGTTGMEDRMFTCTTGTTIYGYGAIQSFRSLNYNAGQGGMARFTGIWSTPAALTWSGVGLINLSDELSFGYNGLDFGIWHRYGGVAEVRTITITGASSGATDLTLTLNNVPYTIPLTNASAEVNAYEIENWLNSNQSVWVADQIDNTVIISAQSDGLKDDTYSFSHATATGTITQNRAGVTKTSTHIPQTSWNNNAMLSIDPSKGNVFQIAYQYLGYGNIKFYVENSETGAFNLVHTIKWANNATRTSLNNPSLRFGIYTASIGSTTDIKVQCASCALFVQGEVFKTRNPRAVKNTQSVSGSFTNVLAVRNRRTYNGLYNQVEIEPINLAVSSESSQNVEIEVRANPTFSGSTDFTNVGTNLISDIDTTNNTASGGRLLAAFTLGSKGSVNVDLKDLEIRIPPSLKISVSARVTGGASSNVTAALTYYEDL